MAGQSRVAREKTPTIIRNAQSRLRYKVQPSAKVRVLLHIAPSITSTNRCITHHKQILQGDIEHYSVQKQITRRLNKKSPGFLSAVGMIWNATRAEMTSRSGEPSVAAAPCPPTSATKGAGGGGDGFVDQEADGIDEVAFVCLMVKVHYLIICPPVRDGLDPLTQLDPTGWDGFTFFHRSLCAYLSVFPQQAATILSASPEICSFASTIISSNGNISVKQTPLYAMFDPTIHS